MKYDREHPCYETRRRLSDRKRRMLERLLRAGKWFWPSERDVEPMKRARDVADTVPEPNVGQIPIVAYRRADETAAVLLLDPRLRHRELYQQRAFEAIDRKIKSLKRAETAWRTACDAVPGALDVLWKPVSPLTRWSPEAIYVGGTAPSNIDTMDGASFGLPFGLAVASLLLDHPLPANVAATGALGSDGRVEAVDGLAPKLRALHDYAPRVERVFVSTQNEEESKAICRGQGLDLDIRAVDQLEEALNDVFPRAEQLIRAHDERSSWIDGLFYLVAGREDAIQDWSPVARAAELTREIWADGSGSELNENERYKIDFTEAVARRSQGGEGTVSIPPSDAWIRELPSPIRGKFVANLVQQATKSDRPDPTAVIELAETFTDGGKDASPTHLKIQGALSRLHYTFGRFDKAKQLQTEVARGWLERRSYEELSYPLGFLYVLAGATRHAPLFERTSDIEDRWVAEGPPTLPGLEYVEPNKGRALVQLGRFDEARSVLTNYLAFDGSGGIPKKLRYRALRWLVHATDELGGVSLPDRARTWRDEMEQDASEAVGGRGLSTRRARLMLQIGRALRADRAGEACQKTEDFLKTEPDSMARLLSHLDVDDQSRPRMAYRYYQY